MMFKISEGKSTPIYHVQKNFPALFNIQRVCLLYFARLDHTFLAYNCGLKFLKKGLY